MNNGFRFYFYLSVRITGPDSNTSSGEEIKEASVSEVHTSNVFD